MPKLFGLPRARSELAELYMMVGRDRPIAAERLIDRIEVAADLLRDHPLIGQ